MYNDLNNIFNPPPQSSRKGNPMGRKQQTILQIIKHRINSAWEKWIQALVLPLDVSSVKREDKTWSLLEVPISSNPLGIYGKEN